MHAAFLQPNQIGLAVREALADIDMFHEHALHGVNMTVDPDDLGLDAPRTFVKIVRTYARRSNQKNE
jgi:hypothetical protein